MADHPTTSSAAPSPSRRGIRLALAIAVLVLGSVALWSAAQSGRATGSAGSVDHSAHAAPPPADPHAGHGANVGSTPGAAIQLQPGKALSLGVTSVEAELAPLVRTIRTTGNITYDETRLTTVTPKFSGFAERLHIDFTGQSVRAGQPLLEIYSPDLLAAQEELLAALRLQRELRGADASALLERTDRLVDAARRRLLLWDVSPAQVEEIERTQQARRTLTLLAPFGGFVVEKMVEAGQVVETGVPLYRLADLSRVWVEADVYEQDLRFVRQGEAARVEIAAYPGELFHGRVSYLYPEVSTETRTARMRIALQNPGRRVKPGMYATVEVDAPVSEHAVVVPRDAVMHSGTHAMVFIDEGEGVYRAREVTVGADVGARTQVLSGLRPGERVVARANFLLDAESRLTESLGAMPGMNH